MKYAKYVILGFIVFWSFEILSVYIGEALGPGPFGIGVVVSAISMLSSIVVVCTIIVVDAIKSIQNK